MQFLNNIPRVTKNLIIINVIIFLATMVNKEFMISNFALFLSQNRSYQS